MSRRQSPSPQPRPGILDISPYVPGSSGDKAQGPVFKLSSNESALGVSPAVLDALKASGENIHLYPDGGASALRETIGARHGLDPARIICGAGSDEILQLLARGYLGPGDSIVQTTRGFLVYALAAKACGARVNFAPERNLTADVDAILNAVDDTTRLVFLANPNNPTGTYLADEKVRYLRDNLRSDIILVIDSAYAEYMEADDYAPGDALVDAGDNVVMTRTFSKIYGLGGLRLGWGYFPVEIADVINRIRGPFNISASAMVAGIAAIGDQAFVAENRAHNVRERNRLVQRIGGLGLEFVPGVANFILVRFPPDPARDAKAALGFLARCGVIVRDMTAYGLPEYLRISIGSVEANNAFIDGLVAFMEDGHV